MNEPIKPCPFCGSEANLNSDLFAANPRAAQSWVTCKNNLCNAHTHSSTEKNKAIEAWNTRTLSEQPANVTALRAALERLSNLLQFNTPLEGEIQSIISEALAGAGPDPMEPKP